MWYLALTFPPRLHFLRVNVRYRNAALFSQPQPYEYSRKRHITFLRSRWLVIITYIYIIFVPRYRNLFCISTRSRLFIYITALWTRPSSDGRCLSFTSPVRQQCSNVLIIVLPSLVFSRCTPISSFPSFSFWIFRLWFLSLFTMNTDIRQVYDVTYVYNAVRSYICICMMCVLHTIQRIAVDFFIQ